MRELRAAALLCSLSGIPAAATGEPLTILDVPFIAQSELLCGGAAAAMVMRCWGERGIDADAFTALVDEKAGGITATHSRRISARQWEAVDGGNRGACFRRSSSPGKRPVIVLLLSRNGRGPSTTSWSSREVPTVWCSTIRRALRFVLRRRGIRSALVRLGRWMLVVTPATSDPAKAVELSSTNVVVNPALGAGGEAATCDRLVAEGVRQAQGEDLASAERTFASAMACPGSAPFRELARAPRPSTPLAGPPDLAAAAVKRDPSDAYPGAPRDGSLRQRRSVECA